MRKKILQLSLLVCILSLAKISQAQIVLTADDYPRDNTFTTSNTIATNLEVVLPTEGPAQIWDYSFLTPGAYSSRLHIDAEGNAVFPSATSSRPSSIDFTAFSVENTIYERKDETGVYVLGTDFPLQSFPISAITGGANDVLEFGGLNVHEGNPKLLELPLVYDDEYTTEYKAFLDFNVTVAAYGLNATPGQRIRTYSGNSSVAGYGQLILPDENGNPSDPFDVLLVKYESTYVDSFTLGGAAAPDAILAAFDLTQNYMKSNVQYGFFTKGLNSSALHFYIVDGFTEVTYNSDLVKNDAIKITQNNFDRSGTYIDTLYTANEQDAPLPSIGRNQIWDYSFITPQSTSINEHFDATNDPNFMDATGYAVSNRNFQSFIIQSKLYERVDADGWVTVGRYNQESEYSITPISGGPNDAIKFVEGAFPYQPENILLPFPLEYDKEWNSDHQSSLNYELSVAAFGLNNVPGSQIKTNFENSDVVGSGLLILPDTDGFPLPPIAALLVKSTVTAIDSFTLGGAAAPDALLSAFGLVQNQADSAVRYGFYAPGYRSAILFFDDVENTPKVTYRTRRETKVRKTIYVNSSAAGSGNGTSWDNAYPELSDALANYNQGDEIWVSQGTYIPASVTGFPNPKKTFHINKDVKIYGGFIGNETLRNERDPVNNVTVISGDILGDDLIDDFDNNKDDNVENVIFISALTTDSTVIDGFTIMGGFANGIPSEFTDLRGAGLFTFGPTVIENCIFRQNFATNHGAGAYYYNTNASGSLLNNCLFENNVAGENGGGLIFGTTGEEITTISNCTFKNNTCSGFGGGINSVRSRINVFNCVFENNTSATHGGGIYLYDSDDFDYFTSVIDNCKFISNKATFGGGLNISIYSSYTKIQVTNCEFTGNTSEIFDPNEIEPPVAGGMRLSFFDFASESSFLVNNCSFKNNTSTGLAGAIVLINLSYDGGNAHIISNCSIEDNSAGQNAGGIGMANDDDNADVQIINTTFSNNTSPAAGAFAVTSPFFNPYLDSDIYLVNCLFNNHNNTDGVVIGTENHDIDLINCTMADNLSPAVGMFENASVQIQNNIIQSGPSPNFVNPGNNERPVRTNGGNLLSDNTIGDEAIETDQTDTDALFESGTYQLSENSSAIDRGMLPEDPIEFDLAGNDRIQGGCIDIGAYESAFDAGNGCVTGVKEVILTSNTISIFPNPAYDVVQLEFDNSWTDDLSIKVINSLGQVVINESAKQTTTSYTLSIKDLHVGSYKLLISDGYSMTISSLIKM